MTDANQLKINATPVFFANKRAYEGNYPVICNEGGTRCFGANTLVRTMNGLIPIQDIQEGYAVKTQNGWNEVIETHKFKNTKKAIRIKLKNGKLIECTDDHKFYFRGRWIEIKNILSLLNENNTKL